MGVHRSSRMQWFLCVCLLVVLIQASFSRAQTLSTPRVEFTFDNDFDFNVTDVSILDGTPVIVDNRLSLSANESNELGLNNLVGSNPDHVWIQWTGAADSASSSSVELGSGTNVFIVSIDELTRPASSEDAANPTLFTVGVFITFGDLAAFGVRVDTEPVEYFEVAGYVQLSNIRLSGSNNGTTSASTHVFFDDVLIYDDDVPTRPSGLTGNNDTQLQLNFDFDSRANSAQLPVTYVFLFTAQSDGSVARREVLATSTSITFEQPTGGETFAVEYFASNIWSESSRVTGPTLTLTGPPHSLAITDASPDTTSIFVSYEVNNGGLATTQCTASASLLSDLDGVAVSQGTVAAEPLGEIEIPNLTSNTTYNVTLSCTSTETVDWFGSRVVTTLEGEPATPVDPTGVLVRFRILLNYTTEYEADPDNFISLVRRDVCALLYDMNFACDQVTIDADTGVEVDADAASANRTSFFVNIFLIDVVEDDVTVLSSADAVDQITALHRDYPDGEFYDGIVLQFADPEFLAAELDVEDEPVSDDTDSDDSRGALIGAVIGGVLGCCLFGALFYFLCWKRRNGGGKQSRPLGATYNNDYNRAGGSVGMAAPANGHSAKSSAFDGGDDVSQLTTEQKIARLETQLQIEIESEQWETCIPIREEIKKLKAELARQEAGQRSVQHSPQHSQMSVEPLHPHHHSQASQMSVPPHHQSRVSHMSTTSVSVQPHVANTAHHQPQLSQMTNLTHHTPQISVDNQRLGAPSQQNTAYAPSPLNTDYASSQQHTGYAPSQQGIGYASTGYAESQYSAQDQMQGGDTGAMAEQGQEEYYQQEQEDGRYIDPLDPQEQYEQGGDQGYADPGQYVQQQAFDDQGQPLVYDNQGQPQVYDNQGQPQAYDNQGQPQAQVDLVFDDHDQPQVYDNGQPQAYVDQGYDEQQQGGYANQQQQQQGY